MKKKALVAITIVFGLQVTHAQKSVSNELPERYFKEGKEMFISKNYVGAEHSLSEFKKNATDSSKIKEANFLLLASQFLRGKNVEIELKEYLDDYPETSYRNETYFYIGSSLYAKKEWKKAIFWLNQADLDYLSAGDQEDYAFRLAYANLQEGNKDEAYRLFRILTKSSQKYSEPASYYAAYIDFRNGDYETSIAVFEALKKKPEYREDAMLYLTQAAYLQNDIAKTIQEGEKYIKDYPNSRNSAEIYRLLGNSYAKQDNVNASIANYEKYIALEKSPLRDDMYLLGNMYYDLGANQKAVDALKKVASTTDQLGQAAYMRLGQTYLRLNDDANALMAFDAASRVKHAPSVSEPALYNYALLVHKSSFAVFDESISVFQRFLTEYPNSKYTSNVNSILASTFLSTKNYRAALSAINKISNPDKKILAAKQTVLYQLGAEAFINSDNAEALKNFDAAIMMGDYDKSAKTDAYFWRGELNYRQGNYQSAVNDYQSYVNRASSSDVNYTQSLYNLGYAYFNTKQYSQASSNFQKYVSAERDRTNATYSDALNRLGDCQLFARKFSEAERYYSQAVSANPSNADYAEYQKAFVLGLQRNYQGKVSALDNMMSKYPTSRYYPDALYEKSRALIMQNKEQSAIPVLEKLLKEFPNHEVTKQGGIQLGQVYFNVNDPNNSIRAYKHVVETYPNTVESRTAVKSLEGVYKDINDISSYAAYVNTLGGVDKISVSRQDSLTFLAAENVYMKGQYSEAKTSMNKYLQSYPDGVYASDAHFYLGSVAYNAKDYNQALQEFTKVIGMGSQKYLNDALIYASGIEFDNANYDNAYKYYHRLSQTATNVEDRQVGKLGMLRSAQLLNKHKEVISAATSLIADAKTSPEVKNEAIYYRAKSYLGEGNKESAVKDLQLLAKDPRTTFGAEAQYLLANAYLKAKEYDKAESQVMSFMKQGTPHEYWMAKALIVLADTYQAKGDSFQAQQYLESLKANYKGTEADIATALEERLK